MDWTKAKNDAIQALTGADNKKDADRRNQALRQRENAPPQEQVANALRRLEDFWKRKGEGFKKYWLDLPRDQQRAMLLCCNPFLLEKADDTRVKRDGMDEDLRDSAVILPEMNVENLLSNGGQGLLRMIEKRIEHLSQVEAVQLEDGADMILATICDYELDISLIEEAYSKKLLQKKRPKEFVFLQTVGEHVAGSCMKAQDARGLAAMTKMMNDRQGLLMYKDVYETVMQRQLGVIACLTGVVDLYVEEVLGKNKGQIIMKAQGCANCGASATAELKLKSCGGCLLVSYCCPACSRAHWPQHKLGCARLDKQKRKEVVVSPAATTVHDASNVSTIVPAVGDPATTTTTPQS
ncbi:hypothetical protein CEUSTIGMA_g6076.t1 [Chlamydomonas eustigma]|uniref:MYND-type domain-containing protein n=1 Tax=Chlamydomonas eustigma TaxID=1157962 RepID=A0A250X6D9_9CHLO|nr:hypothetical protein CEUSTIGMA_g6076.t1 [Chlamydomonas eustigma]|eukprot:GAX78638.1 hypothetical protein CEUSTIGMA_g6076.t1 [Chlamydomonas eustigma]